MHTELGKRVKGVYGPKRLQMKGWVGINTQSLGKGLKESIDPRGCR
jgi:hypothetical protein